MYPVPDAAVYVPDPPPPAVIALVTPLTNVWVPNPDKPVPKVLISSPI